LLPGWCKISTPAPAERENTRSMELEEPDSTSVGGKKSCNVCHVEQPEDRFHFQLSRKNGERVRYRDRTCKMCRANQKRARDRTRPSRLGMPGLSPTAQRFLALRFGVATTSATSVEDARELAGA
jgi:hypothetical protein